VKTLHNKTAKASNRFSGKCRIKLFTGVVTSIYGIKIPVLHSEGEMLLNNNRPGEARLITTMARGLTPLIDSKKSSNTNMMLLTEQYKQNTI